MSNQDVPTSTLNSSSEIRLLERVRLHSFQGLLPDADSRVRCPGKHAPVLIEDILKAEIVSLQLMLALEEVTKSVKQLFGTKQSKNTGMHANAVNGQPENESSLQSVQNALSKGSNALNQLTKIQSLQISSENFTDSDMPEPRDTSSRKDPNSVSSSIMNRNDQRGETSEQKVPGTTAKRLCYSSEGSARTIWTPDAHTGATMWNEDSVICEQGGCEVENMEYSTSSVGGERIEDIVKDTIETLRNEIEELQIKHEKQFVAFAGKYWSQEDQCMRKLLEKIMANLSPQDKNWTYHGKFDDHCMEQLFYFVSLQKTLKSCLALLNSITMDDSEEEHIPQEMQAVTQPDQACCASKQNDRKATENEEAVMQQACSCQATVRDGVTMEGNGFAAVEPATGDPPANNIQSTSQTNHKRSMNDFDDTQQHKRLKKSKGIFACFNTRWSKNRKRH